MIKVVFFAALREQLACSELTLSDDNLTTVAQLKSYLANRGEIWQQALANQAILTAVNHQLVSSETSLNTGDEVAFFPPVTGG